MKKEPLKDFSNWISIAKELPAPVEAVLVVSTIPDSQSVYIARWMPHASPPAWWLRDEPLQLLNVTHWQPLPELPSL